MVSAWIGGSAMSSAACRCYQRERLTMSRGVLAMFSLKCFNTNPTRSHPTGPGNTYLKTFLGLFTPQTTP